MILAKWWHKEPQKSTPPQNQLKPVIINFFRILETSQGFKQSSECLFKKISWIREPCGIKLTLVLSWAPKSLAVLKITAHIPSTGTARTNLICKQNEIIFFDLCNGSLEDLMKGLLYQPLLLRTPPELMLITKNCPRANADNQELLQG